MHWSDWAFCILFCLTSFSVTSSNILTISQPILNPKKQSAVFGLNHRNIHYCTDECCYPVYIEFLFKDALKVVKTISLESYLFFVMLFELFMYPLSKIQTHNFVHFYSCTLPSNGLWTCLLHHFKHISRRSSSSNLVYLETWGSLLQFKKQSESELSLKEAWLQSVSLLKLFHGLD